MTALDTGEQRHCFIFRYAPSCKFT